MAGTEGYDAATYGESIADVYDDLPTHPRDAEEAAACLAELAGAGSALELAIGTGRVALLLAGRGVAVSGIDASEAMVAKLRAKPGGDAIPVTIGDFADVDVDGRFALVFIVYNTLFALLDQATQQRCFERVAEHLAPGGRFVVEAFVPDTSRFERDQHVEVRHIDADAALLSLSRHYPRPNAWTRCSSGSRATAPGPGLCTSGTPTRASSISWPNRPGCGSSTAGTDGSTSSTRTTV